MLEGLMFSRRLLLDVVPAPNVTGAKRQTCEARESPLLLRWGRRAMAIKFGVNLATANPDGWGGSIATQKTNISSSLFHHVPRMARSAASQPLLLAGPLDAAPLRYRGACIMQFRQVHDLIRGKHLQQEPQL